MIVKEGSTVGLTGTVPQPVSRKANNMNPFDLFTIIGLQLSLLPAFKSNSTRRTRPYFQNILENSGPLNSREELKSIKSQNTFCSSPHFRRLYGHSERSESFQFFKRS